MPSASVVRIASRGRGATGNDGDEERNVRFQGVDVRGLAVVEQIRYRSAEPALHAPF